jgi:hypothetical protein
MKKNYTFTAVYLVVWDFQAKIEFKAKDNTIDYGTVSKDSDSGVRTFIYQCSVMRRHLAT